ncbi:unnamed protein product [Penicillium salamii]|uniref:Uncharacterized protein n=1 Tax=Penicillium salamii TaxID=1612424 RepID=A0A9W4JP55_9EURO|nr:unnamed protein product [Penicillium salamii]CAG8380880.1 unnamed protein product [Penicillium salamii]CAG8412517.1 unnamed protein product [Penicillium salamii]CAG8413013.1 unnamed protein product [Penicillium salamii]
MSLLFYLISNNLFLSDPDEDPDVMEQDEQILEILKDTGWDDFKHLKRLIPVRMPTAESIAERIFCAAVRQDDFDLVQKMLQAGMNPDEVVIENSFGEVDGSLFTALQHVSVTSRCASSINLLINHGADVNFSLKADGKTALFYAIEAINVVSIRVLLAQHATVTPECVYSATLILPNCKEDLSWIEDIIEIYLDQDVAMQGDAKAALLDALTHRHKHIVERFLAKEVNLNGLLTTRAPDGENECQTTLLGLAAEYGDAEIVRLLLHLSFHEDPSLLCPPYVQPLVFAAKRGSIDICKILVGSNADIQSADEGEKTLLERTLPRGNLALCQLLIDHGAKIDRQPRETHQRPSALMVAVQHGLMDIVDLLINSGARLNDLFEVGPRTVLGAAVGTGDEELIQKLYNAGARWTFAIRKIGSLKIAMLIKEKGILSKLLNHRGPQLLVEAILARDDDLAWFLLQNNAHEERNKTGPRTRTPLWAAIESDQLGFVVPLLDLGAKVTDTALAKAIKTKSTVLQILLAAFTGSAPTAVTTAVLEASMIDLELLRKAKVDLRGAPLFLRGHWSCNPVKSTPYGNSRAFQSVLEIAAWKADAVIFKYILEWASALQVTWSPTSVACALTLAILEQKTYHISELIRLGSDLDVDIAADVPPSLWDFDVSEPETYSPLQAAVRTQQLQIVRDLLDLKRADVNYMGEGQFRKTPLQHAVKLGNMEIINILLEQGADINAPPAHDSGATALQIAAIQGFIGIARMLLDLGADVNQKPAKKDGRTALMGAAEHGRIDMLHMLLDEGAEITGEYECYFREAVELAEGKGHCAAARLLKRSRDRVRTPDHAQAPRHHRRLRLLGPTQGCGQGCRHCGLAYTLYKLTKRYPSERDPL